jgi:putative ABC transport system permease protein
MSWLTRLRNVFRSDALSEDIDRELAFHLAQRTDDLVAHGMAPDVARREARRRFGNVGMQKEDVRGRDLLVWLETMIADARYAIRGLRAAPGFAGVAVLSLALGIGANTAIFTLVNVAMFKPLPVSHPEELVELTISGGEPSKGGNSFSRRMWEQLRDRQDVFAGAFAYGSTGSGDLSTGGEMRPIPVGLVTGGFFSTLGVQPAAGRLLVDADDRPGCSGVVVLTHAFWRSEFGADPTAVGKTLQITGKPFTVVGVAESRFFGLGFGYYPPVWAPQCAGPLLRGASYSGGGAVIARLKLGITIDQARARLQALTPGILEASMPPAASARAVERHRAIQLGATSFERGFRFVQLEYGETLLVLMAIVGVVLLIACANTANLLLARATARQREVGVRLALGASRWRLVRQLLTESLSLAVMGALLGVLLAVWGSRALVSLLSRQGRPMLAELQPDANVLGFTIAVTVITAVIFGLAPAWRAVRVDAQNAIKPGGRGAVEGHSRFSITKGLVVAQVALSLVMLAGATLLIGSWQRLMSIDPGFSADSVLVVSVGTRPAQIPDSQLTRLYRDILGRVRNVPGVEVASAAIRTPIANTGWTAAIMVDGYEARAGDSSIVQLNEISDRYFSTIGARLLLGRDFNSGDLPTSSKVIIVSEALARKYFGGSAALGRSLRIDWGREGVIQYEIVGIAGNMKDHSLLEEHLPSVYFALGQNPSPLMDVRMVVRGRDPGALAPSVTAVIMQANRRLSLRTRTLRDYVDDSVRVQRTLGVLSGFFGALALLLASIGLYGVMSYSVARRRNEIGVRIAMGADRSRIVRMVLGDVGRIVTFGLVIGAAISLATLRVVSSFLYGVEPGDLASLALSATILAAVAVSAAMFPAWRAGKMDPVVALRAE